jgi:hypothetical protein
LPKRPRTLWPCSATAESLARLERLVAEHPGVEVRLGHQR